MDAVLRNLSTEIWENTSYSPSADSIIQFWDKLKAVNISDFIVYNFINHQGTYLEDLLLSIFPLWKEFKFYDWKDIFKRLEGNKLAEYYMQLIADRYLGIDPGFESTKGVKISAITFPDTKLHNASAFAPNSTDALKHYLQKTLKDRYSLTFEDIIEVNRRLTQV